MTNKRSSGSGVPAPVGADDLKSISGIGPSVAQRLYGAGIMTFSQLADLSPDEIAALVTDLTGKSAALITKQDWIGQARALASMPPEAEPQDDTLIPAEPQNNVINSVMRMHPATFTVELQLHEDNTVHHTRVTHHQSEDKGSWASWEEARLVGFIVGHAELCIPQAEPSVLVSVPVEPPSAPTVPTEPSVLVAAPVEPTVPTERAPQAARMADLVNMPHLRVLEAVSTDTAEPRRILHCDKPFDVRLTFDLTDVAVAGNAPIDYTAAIYAKSMASHSRRTLGEVRGVIGPGNTIIVNVKSNVLVPGMYRLEATMMIMTPQARLSRPASMAMIESGLLQVY
jgi:hypothetical protein